MFGTDITRADDHPGHRENYSGATQLLAAHEAGDLAAVGEAQLVQDVLDVVGGGAFGQVEPLRDGAVRQAVGDELGDLPFAPGEASGRR